LVIGAPHEQRRPDPPGQEYHRVGIVPAKEQTVIIAELFFQREESGTGLARLDFDHEWHLVRAEGVNVDVMGSTTKSARTGERKLFCPNPDSGVSPGDFTLEAITFLSPAGAAGATTV
jgi:hypothetical protein